MIDLFRPAQVQAMDRRAFDRGVTAAALMERAAGHLTRAIVASAGFGYGLRVGILCGAGNNGGDGIAAGRRLLDAGAAPAVCVVPGVERLQRLPVQQLQRYLRAGGRVANSVEAALEGADVAVDCLLGTGSSGEPRPPHRQAVETLNRGAFTAVIACDLPTGVDPDTGQVPGVAVRADTTVTLGAHKRGLWLWPARGLAGHVVLGELDIVDRDDEPVARVLGVGDAARLLPPPPPDSHKRTRGVVVVLAGSPGMSGAATMVARGAMVAGAGLVSVATSAAVRDLIAPTVPEALTTDLPDDDPDGAYDRVAAQLQRADALALGPGLGTAPGTVTLVHRLLRETQVPVVCDADGLNAFRDEPDALAGHAAPLLVLTPHAGEFARLVGRSGHAAWARRVELVPERARAWNAVVVAKGPGTMIAAPDGRVWINPTGGAALSTGGTGDVLTGLTATLVAQRPQPESVAAAVYVHGLAGQLAAARRTVRSVTALDVAAAVPQALARLQQALT